MPFPAVAVSLPAAFAAWPERIYILGTGGRVLYKGDMGPFGFHPEAAEESLRSILSPAWRSAS